MAGDQKLELWRAHRATQEKHTYFLLAAAGACIGFALTQSKDLHIEWMHIPLAAALLCWASSFWLGCRNVDWTLAVISSNMGLLQIKSGDDPLAGRDPSRISLGLETVGEIISTQQRSVVSASRWQNRQLIAGVVCYVAWQILLMHSRTLN